MDGYWDYKNAGTLKSLTDEQRTLLLGLNILNAIGGGYYGSVAGELSSLLENTFTLLNSQKNFVFENFEKNGKDVVEGKVTDNLDFRLKEVYLNITSDKCFWYSYSCEKISEVTLVPAYYYRGKTGSGYADIILSGKEYFWNEFEKVPVTEKNLTQTGIITENKTVTSPSLLGIYGYYFGFNGDKAMDFRKNLRPGFYTVKVKYKDGRVYIRPLLIRESGTYSITTG
jgi:hypothetical protein